MPSDSPVRPRSLSGALVVYESPTPVATRMIVFQYNPEGVTRTFVDPTAPVAGAAAGASPPRGAAPTRPLEPPVESFQFSVELDAADQLELADPLTVSAGLHPALASLELLLYPNVVERLLNRTLAKAGMAMVSTARLPVVLLVWGPSRVVPVRVTSVSITEQAFDQQLNPILAKVDLGLRALSEAELSDAGMPFEGLGISNQLAKVALAAAAPTPGAQDLTRMLPS